MSLDSQSLKRTRLGLTVAGSAFLLAACSPENVATPPQPVQIIEVTLAPQIQGWSYVGVVRPRHESDLGFRVGGKIIERRVDVGQHVTPGQVLARLEATDFRLSTESNEAELRAALSSREQAIAAEERFKALFSRGHVAKAALDQRTAAADEARARVERAERSLELARNQLSYSELRAEHAGVISALPVEVGQVMSAGQIVARLARLDSLEAQVAIPEHMLNEVRVGAASVEIWNSAGRKFGARLRELSPEADRVSRTYQARFSIEAPDEDIQLGRTATVHIHHRADTADVAHVPLAAVMNDGKGAAVWTLDSTETRVRRTPIAVASLAQDHVIVASGLKQGDRVVTLGVHMLDEAKLVRVVERRVASR